mmetsp:Transcript_26175/g.48807  ORF Transcript_26175/g.48807 Transcript_26175/m.48807 type:complete len:101 (-) Transcript_26175:203-505(-)
MELKEKKSVKGRRKTETETETRVTHVGSINAGVDAQDSGRYPSLLPPVHEQHQAESPMFAFFGPCSSSMLQSHIKPCMAFTELTVMIDPGTFSGCQGHLH